MAADLDRTVSCLTVAGEQALDAGGFDEAQGDFDRALSLRPAQDHIRAILHLRRGVALRGLDKWDDAIADWNEALVLFRARSDRASIASTCLELALGYTWKMRASESAACARQGLEALSEEPSPERCRLLAQQAWSLSSLVELDAARASLMEALIGAEAIGDDRLEGAVRVTGHYVYHHNLRSAEGYSSAKQAVECLRTRRDQTLVAEARMQLHYMSVRTGRLLGLAAVEEELECVPERLGRLDLGIMASFMRLRRWLVSGDPEDYEEYAQELLRVFTKMGAWRHLGLACLAQAQVWSGELEEAHRQAAAAVDVEPRAVMETGHGWSALFLADALLDRRTDALQLLEARREQLPRPGTLSGIGAWSALFKVVEGLAVLGEAEHVAELYPQMADAIATGTLVPRDANHLVETLAGVAAAGGAHWERAEAHYQTALRQATEIPFRSEQAEARRWYARMLLDRDARGDREKAGTLLGEAIALYQTIGMPKHVELATKMSSEL